jgi:hypothetical protein
MLVLVKFTLVNWFTGSLLLFIWIWGLLRVDTRKKVIGGCVWVRVNKGLLLVNQLLRVLAEYSIDDFLVKDRQLLRVYFIMLAILIQSCWLVFIKREAGFILIFKSCLNCFLRIHVQSTHQLTFMLQVLIERFLLLKHGFIISCELSKYFMHRYIFLTRRWGLVFLLHIVFRA